MTPTEALARAIWEVRVGGSVDNTHTSDIVANLAALGYEVRPIDDSMGPCADCGHPHPWTPQGVIFDACRCGCQEGIPIHSVTAEAADREAAGATASLGTDVWRPTPSAAADTLDVKRLEEAMYEVAVNQMNLFDWPSAKDVAAAYAAAKDSPSSPDGLDVEAGGG